MQVQGVHRVCAAVLRALVVDYKFDHHIFASYGPIVTHIVNCVCKAWPSSQMHCLCQVSTGVQYKVQI